MVLPGVTTSYAALSDPGDWAGMFDGFSRVNVGRHRGVDTPDGHNWGWDQMRPVSDPDPAKGTVLRVLYGQGSGAHSCYQSGDCPNSGGGQFYMDLNALGRSDPVEHAVHRPLAATDANPHRQKPPRARDPRTPSVPRAFPQPTRSPTMRTSKR